MFWLSAKSRRLIGAIENGDVEGVHSALAEGANPNARSEGETPLIKAARQGRVDMVRMLIAAGADVNKSWRGLRPVSGIFPFGETPLIWAATRGDAEMVTVLLEAGAKVDALVSIPGAPSWSALTRAASEGHREVVGLLLAAGASAAGSFQDRPLVGAVRGGDPEIVRMLIGAGADAGEGVTWESNSAGLVEMTPLEWAFDRKNNDIVQILEDAGAKPSNADLSGVSGPAIDDVLRRSCPKCGKTGWDLGQMAEVRVRFDANGPFLHPSSRLVCGSCGASSAVADLQAGRPPLAGS